MSPQQSPYSSNSIAKLKTAVPYGTSLTSGSQNSLPCASKSPAELRKEIAVLEDEILHLEHHLLSLYRTAFNEHLPSRYVPSIHRPFTPGSPAEVLVRQSHDILKSHIRIDTNFNHRDLTSAAYGHPSSDDQTCGASLCSASTRNAGSGRSSLAHRLGASCLVSNLNTPDRLSEDIVRCISSIYNRLANPLHSHAAGLSASPVSSSSSSSVFSSHNPCDYLSPLSNEDGVAYHHLQGLKEGGGPYAGKVEVLKICLDDSSFSYAAVMLNNFRTLVRSLEKVDPGNMNREQKLAFWINIHNALLMHAYLAYGTHNRVKKSASNLKAAYNVGGHCINACIIQNSILGIRSHYSEPWLQTWFSTGRKLKTGSIRHVYALEYPEPLVHFALCSGSCSDPAVRMYTAKGIFQELKLAKEEFIQSSVHIHKEEKIVLPKILSYYAKDMSMDMGMLLEEISVRLTEVQRKEMRKCTRGKLDKSIILWLAKRNGGPGPKGRAVQIEQVFSKSNRNLSRSLAKEEEESAFLHFQSMIHFVLLISRQGKVRLAKWYSPHSSKERSKVIRELSGIVLNRGPKLCNFVEWKGLRVVYRRYAGLYFCVCVDEEDNELEVLDIIHHFVEILDRYFGSVCELDLIFNFHKAYYILDEILIAGELQESSKRTVIRFMSAHDSLVEMAKEQASSISNVIAQVTR